MTRWLDSVTSGLTSTPDPQRLKPGDLPRPQSRKERLTLARTDHAGLGNDRPIEDTNKLPYDACTQSRYSRHEFATRGGVLICTFCRRSELECRRK